MRKHYETYPSHPLGVMSHQMGNLMFYVAYRTMDIFQHEAHIFQEALRYFHEAYIKYMESGRHVHNLEDQILLIYAALGHDALAFQEIYRILSMTPTLSTPASSPSSTNKELTMPHEHADLLELLPDAPWRTSHLAILLLLKMRVLSRLRTHQNHYNVFQDTHVGMALEQVHSVVHTILMGTPDAIRTQEEQIRRILARIPVELMQAMYHSRPMTHTDAPRLFHVLVPTECWQILQECFRLTPGAEKMIHEHAFASQEASADVDVDVEERLD
ncbi:hypothetical protein MHU86_13174 [Fragilaria crotonensis]|nr:hypothetical protein MHU86_13174 [Fragilaria crotonensis]